jgi:hypothetical protein
VLHTKGGSPILSKKAVKQQQGTGGQFVEKLAARLTFYGCQRSSADVYIRIEVIGTQMVSDPTRPGMFSTLLLSAPYARITCTGHLGIYNLVSP